MATGDVTGGRTAGGGMWGGEQLDLDAYLARIGYEGDRRPTLETLRAVHRAHVLALPFENLEPVLGRGVPLGLDALQDKLLRQPRGGYCFEHVTLHAAALERLGFTLTAYTGRVRMGSDKIKPATHALLRVETEETPETGHGWLSDVGFGAGPLTPLQLADGAEATAGDWRYRLERRTVSPGAEGWMLYEWDVAGQRWFDRHSFTTEPQYPVDFAVAGHFVATHPRSPFVARPYVQRVAEDRLHVLDGTALTVFRSGDGSRETRELEPRETPKVLADLFGVQLSQDDERLLVARLENA